MRCRGRWHSHSCSGGIPCHRGSSIPWFIGGIVHVGKRGFGKGSSKGQSWRGCGISGCNQGYTTWPGILKWSPQTQQIFDDRKTYCRYGNRLLVNPVICGTDRVQVNHQQALSPGSPQPLAEHPGAEAQDADDQDTSHDQLAAAPLEACALPDFIDPAEKTLPHLPFISWFFWLSRSKKASTTRPSKCTPLASCK